MEGIGISMELLVAAGIGLVVVIVSAVFAVLSRETVGEQAWFALKLFAAFVGAAFAAGWLLYPLPL